MMDKCCLDPACSHAVVAAAHQEATKLTDAERQKILAVLSRNQQIQREQQQRILRLKAELQSLRRKGALRASSADFDSTGPDPDRSCGRCRVELGRVINRGAYCRACRLKVCKGCREYSFRTTDWVCTVCHKRMEIQAASGEWMNEFVRRPSRRRDTRVYVPAADIIIRTLRRSWTISNPTPRWNTARDAPEMRPYNSLPRGQDIASFPSLAGHKRPNELLVPNDQNQKQHASAKRCHSEEIYSDRGDLKEEEVITEEKPKDDKSSVRVNPLIKYASERRSSEKENRPKKKLQVSKPLEIVKATSEKEEETAVEVAVEESVQVAEEPIPKAPGEKRVSFDEQLITKLTAEDREGRSSVKKPHSRSGTPYMTRKPSLKESDDSSGQESSTSRELCDIEPLSGTVFRKVTVKRRRNDMKKMEAVDNGWRRTEPDFLDILLPDGDDYKLVFISSDSSSKEEDPDDNDSSSTASSFPIDEGDWDYFEPGTSSSKVIGLQSPFGSPGLDRKSLESPIGSPLIFRKFSSRRVDSESSSDGYQKSEDVGHGKMECSQHMKNLCQSCGAITQFVPFPVPVPIPVPMPIYSQENSFNYDKLVQSRFMQFLPRSTYNLISPMITDSSILLSSLLTQARAGVASEAQVEPERSSSEARNAVECTTENNEDMATKTDANFGYLLSETNLATSSDSDDDKPLTKRSYNISVDCRSSDDALPTSDVSSSEESSSGDSDTDTDDTGTVADKKSKKFSCVYVVNKNSDSENDPEDNCVVLKTIKPIPEDDNKCCYNSSPGLSDISDDCSDDANRDDLVGSSGANSEGRQLARFTSLVLITQADVEHVNVVTSDTTKLINETVTVRHTNSQGDALLDGDEQMLEETDVVVKHTNLLEEYGEMREVCDDNVTVVCSSATCDTSRCEKNSSRTEPIETESTNEDNVTVITSADTLSAVVCLEEGLADDDSWVENLSHEDDFDEDSTTSSEEVTLTCSDQEDELRGYHRTAIDFTLHTIVEESCEESEVEQTQKKSRPISATDLEKYFFYGLGDGSTPSLNREEAFSETSSICSESLDSLGGGEKTPPIDGDPAELASSRLEKYFLSGFMGFKERRDSDGSVGSDSEGKPSPEQRRKRLVRARGTGRSHSSSLDNLLANELSGNEQSELISEDSDTDTFSENNFEKLDGQFDTVKRKKNKKKINGTNSPEDSKIEDVDEEKVKKPLEEEKKQRDSGFVGSSDDLVQKEPIVNSSPKLLKPIRDAQTTPPMTNLTRKDSFNNCSSDEETNLMMCKMRQFFKTMVASNNPPNSKPTTPIMNSSPKSFSSPRLKKKPPQLVYFENELTRLMKTVPGIRDDQVREIVEYLSSEDTWSDSYDSSDYTSSDLEGSCVKSVLQQQISDSCQEIINKFDKGVDDEGDEGDGGIDGGLNKETAFVYQKLVASIEKIADDNEKITLNNSPPLIAKVMHHIGKRLVALMHEVSSGESHCSTSPKSRHYHRRLQQKLYSASTTEDDSNSDSNIDKLTGLEEVSYNLLPRSKSHDLLLNENKNLHQSDVTEDQVSDNERFSWRGSFESALLATDSRNKLSSIGEHSNSNSALVLAAKRRSAGDLLFSQKSLSREQLDRVRSCGSIGHSDSWISSTKRRSSVPDTTCESGESGDDEEDHIEDRSTLPRSLQNGPATTNSLPRLPTNAAATTSMQKAHSVYHFLQQNVKSARYRPPGFSRVTAPKRAVSAPGLQPTHQRRGRRSQQNIVPNDDASISEAHSSPMLATRVGNKSATPSPIAPSSRRGTAGSISSQEWKSNDDDVSMDKLMPIGPTRNSLSSLGLRSDSMASVYSGAGEGRYGTVTVKGQVEFGLQYNYKISALEVLVKQCRDLAAVDAKRNRSDPYVKLYLLPDKSKGGKRKTKVKKHTLNPTFDECLKFHISLNELETRTLWLTVWHSDMFGRNDFLGEVMMSLENKVFDDPTPLWYNLEERTEPFEDILSFKGDILVGLKFVPPDMTVAKKGKRSRGSLHVLVKEAKSLTAVKAHGTSDPFCKSYLLPDKGRSSKQKTTVIKKTVNPVWNHTFVYDDVTLQELAERCLELTVWDHDRLASNEFLGGVRFSLGTGKHYSKPVDWMDATGKEISLWKSMLERPSFWVEGCLSLRPSLDNRTT